VDPLTPELWERLQALFHQAVELEEGERDAFLERECAGNQPSLAQLRLLLTAFESERRFSSPPPSEAAKHLGGYELIRELGHGGMGTVYLARRADGEYEQQVALKLVSAHLQTGFFTGRFRAERQILAQLNHPNITRLLDGGVGPDGSPYLVMDYVDGIPITRYADQHRLTIPSRLRLFLEICSAVEYAHRNLIVHRDLKPGNILVTVEGVPKLLDFGTAKLLSAGAEAMGSTPGASAGVFARSDLQTAPLLATPSYASPEQLRNEPTTTAMDVYSLGVILFELLAGRRPSNSSSPEKLQPTDQPESPEQAVTGEAAEKRSISAGRMRATLAGDLSAIVTKCLRPLPQDRYAWVNDLAADIQRYLDGRPVLARRQTALYRASKFVRRNRGRLSAAAALLVVTLASLGYAWHQQGQALAEGQRAVRMQTFLYRLFQSANSNVTGKPATTLTEFLRLGVKFLPEYIKDPSDLRQARLGLAVSMFENRDYDAARAIFQQVVHEAQASQDLPAEAEASAYLCSIAYDKGEGDAGLNLCAHAMELAQRPGAPPRTLALSAYYSAALRADLGLIRQPPTIALAELAVKTSVDNHLPPHETAQALVKLADIEQNIGALDRAQALFERALSFYQQDPLALCDQSDVYYGLAGIRRMSGHINDAVPLYKKSFEIYQTCAGPSDRETLRMGAYYAGALAESSRASEAVQFLEDAGAKWKKTFEADAPAWREYWHYMTVSYLAAMRFADAERSARIGLRVCEKWSKDPSKDRTVGMEHFELARALDGEGGYRDALSHAEQAEGILAPTTVSEGAKQVLAQVRALIQDLRSKVAK
jgi:eukaryotic-like serine/threonine-protein kinase